MQNTRLCCMIFNTGCLVSKRTWTRLSPQDRGTTVVGEVEPDLGRHFALLVGEFYFSHSGFSLSQSLQVLVLTIARPFIFLKSCIPKQQDQWVLVQNLQEIILKRISIFSPW